MALYRRGRVWWAEYRDATGRRRKRSLKVHDRMAAKLLYSDLIKSEQLRRAGVLTGADVALAIPAKLVEEYEAELERRQRAHGHVRTVISRLRAIFAGVQRLSDMTPEHIRRTLDRLASRPPYAARSIRKIVRLSPCTINFYRVALSAFFRWLVREGRWPRNPVEAVATVRDTGPQRERRALDPDELRRLLEAAPPSRKLAYRLAATSGLRRGELRTLRWADIDLARGVVTVQARNAKAKRRREVPIPASTIAALLPARGDARPDDLVFPAGIPNVRSLARDLTNAGIQPENCFGVIDFHALRTTYGTNLARAGVPIVQAQRMLGHADPGLTANFYTKLRLEDGQAAASKLDDLLGGPSREDERAAG